MSSYISSFRALLAAMAIVGIVEVAYSAIDPSSPVERSNYVNWNFNSTELFHKVLIHEKLLNAVRDRPNVIQIGDSSGFHGIVPTIVDQYLGGLKYENLSCCANTGFDGYYAIADFMLRNTPSIKAVVLYISLNNTPRDPATVQTTVVGGEDRVRNAFGPLAPFTSPPTLSARPNVVRSVYTLGQTLPQSGLQPFGHIWPELIQFLQTNRGWWPEHDLHQVPEKQSKMLKELCGPTGDRHIDGHTERDYTRDILGIRRSHTEIELRRLADVTARHDAKLILLVQPYPCQAMIGSFIPALQADISAVFADYPNVVVPDPALFEHWPGQWFTSADHLRTGHEDAVSRRAGHSIAKALGLPLVTPREPPAPKPATPVWSSSDFTAPLWRAEGLLLAPKADGKGLVATESTNAGGHYLQISLSDIPAKTYIGSFVFSGVMPRWTYFEFHPLKGAGDSGAFYCSASTLESSRSMGVLDSEIEQLPDHAFRCWGKIRLSKPGAVIRIGLSRTEHNTVPYQGDGRSHFALYSAQLSAIDGAE
jgi:hypothetical protein